MNNKKMLIVLCLVAAVLIAGIVYVATLDYRPIASWDSLYRVSEHASGELPLELVYTSPSDVNISVQSIKVIEDGSYSLCTGTVTMQVVSEVDISVDLSMISYQSMDHLGSAGSKKLELKAGQPQTVIMTYSGWDDGHYWLDITAWDSHGAQGSVRVQMR